jgi:CRISPR-associated protein Csm1
MNQQDQLYISALLNGLEKTSPESAALSEAQKYLLEEEQKGKSLRPLTSILGHIGKAGIHRYYPTFQLALEESAVFAGKDQPRLDSNTFLSNFRSEYQQLNDQYSQEENRFDFKYSLFHLLQTHTSRVAYTSKENCDYSLFDRNRLMAAIVRCQQEEGKKENQPFLLVKGAISGIQTFIYDNIKSEQIEESVGSSKRLRGRSFYVALANHTLSEYIIEQLNLELANIIFVGGGQFTLLLPNTDSIQKTLVELNKEISLGLRNYVGPQLSLVVGMLACTPRMIGSDEIGNSYSKLNDLLEQEKLKKSKSFLQEWFDYTDPPQAYNKEHIRNFKDDYTLGDSAPRSEAIIELTIKKEEDFQQLNIKGRDQVLRSLTFLDKFIFVPKSRNGRDEVFEFLKKNQVLLEKEHIRAKVVFLNQTNLLLFSEQLSAISSKIAYGYRFLGNFAPADSDELVLPFEKIAQLDLEQEKELEFAQLAVMRMDIDDLGSIFFKGLDPQPGFERLMCLSREVQLFFGGYFNLIAEKNKQYVTYSGGDDAFVVGSWKTTLHFAQDLHQAFSRFSCENPNFTLSAGIFMCHPYYPVARFAYDTAELEELSKIYKTPNNKEELEQSGTGKNAVTVYEHTLNWQAFDEMMEFTLDLTEITETDQHKSSEKDGKKIRRSVVRRLLNIIQAVREGEDFEYYRHVAFLHSLLARQGFGHQKLYGNPNKNDKIAEIVRRLLQESQEKERFQDYTIPIHYVLNNTRKRSTIMSKAKHH